MISRIKITILCLNCLCACTIKTQVSKDDIYTNRLVYLKSDSSLFTGTLNVKGTASNWFKTFSNGIPVGKWGEQEKNNGAFVSKGEYLIIKKNLSAATQKMLLNDTVIIDYWQEGGDLPTDPYHLTVIILKEDSFFQSDKKQYNSYIEQLANAVMNDTRNIKYDYLKINFVNAVHNWNKDYYKEYKLVNGKLQEEPKE